MFSFDKFLFFILVSRLGLASSWACTAATRYIKRPELTMMAPQETIELAVEKRNVARTQVILAVQEIEKHTKKWGSVKEEDVDGRFELVFTNAPNAFEGGFLIGGSINGYFGIKEILVIDLKKGDILLEGPLWSRYKGKCSFSRGSIDYAFDDFKVGPIGQEGMGYIQRRYSFSYLERGIALARAEPTGAMVVMKKL